MITLDSKFVQEQKIKNCSVHGTVAAALALNHENPERVYKPWDSVWPTMEDLQSMPFTWSTKEQDHLPPAIKGLLTFHCEYRMDSTNHYAVFLQHQQSKFDRDWLELAGKVPETSKDLYQYYWLIVNTRCFYWTYFKRAKEAARKGKTLSRDDCMALCPFADYLNHADDGVSLSSWLSWFTTLSYSGQLVHVPL